MSSSAEKKDCRSQLAELNKQMKEEMSPEEKRKLEQEERNNRYRQEEINKRKNMLYQFLAGYKQNSGIFINNFFRNRDYETYCEDKFDSFTFDFQGQVLPNLFDDFNFSMTMVRYLSELEKEHVAYFPVDVEYIKQLINFAEVMDLSEPLEEDTVFYRGCTNIDRNGVNGLVSVTTDFKIAEQFSRGTILTVTVPKGTRLLNVNAIRPKKQRRKDLEQEFLLPPCDYEITFSKEYEKGNEPNNMKNYTLFLDLKLKPLDLLEEFLHSMQNPPGEYLPLQVAQNGEYEMAVSYLDNYIKNRNRNKGSRYKKQR